MTPPGPSTHVPRRNSVTCDASSTLENSPPCWPSIPRASLPEASGNRAMRPAASRFFANEASEPQDIRLSPLATIYGRLDTVPVV